MLERVVAKAIQPLRDDIKDLQGGQKRLEESQQRLEAIQQRLSGDVKQVKAGQERLEKGHGRTTQVLGRLSEVVLKPRLQRELGRRAAGQHIKLVDAGSVATVLAPLQFQEAAKGAMVDFLAEEVRVGEHEYIIHRNQQLPPCTPVAHARGHI